MSNALLVDKIDGSIIVRFNRPQIRNPLSVAVVDELQEVVARAAPDRDTRRLIFTGTDSVFASGADLREISSVTAASAASFARRGQQLMHAISSLPFPSIAAIGGVCFGGALDLALACSMRIASAEAMFSHPGAGLGIMTGWGGTQRLPRLIGEARALEIFYTARRVDALEALSIGLVDRIEADPLAAAMTIS